jgi:hypothetical protein
LPSVAFDIVAASAVVSFEPSMRRRSTIITRGPRIDWPRRPR